MSKNIYVCLLAMSVATYLIRILPILLIRKEIKNTYIRSFLYYVPYVTLSVMTFPAILTATQSIISGALALVVAVALSWKDGNLFRVAMASCLVVFVSELLL